MADYAGQVITTASSRGRSLDVEERQKRYAITMSIRTACFLLFLVVPGWWKLATLAGAAFLPVIAVVLANGEDKRPAPLALEDEEKTLLALPPGEVVKGEVL